MSLKCNYSSGQIRKVPVVHADLCSPAGDDNPEMLLLSRTSITRISDKKTSRYRTQCKIMCKIGFQNDPKFGSTNCSI